MRTAHTEHAPEDGLEPPPPVKVRTHPGLCEGWGECHRWAPEVYPLDEHGHVAVHTMEVPSEHAEDAWFGATACPQRAITVIRPPEGYWYDRMRRRREQQHGQIPHASHDAR